MKSRSSKRNAGAAKLSTAGKEKAVAEKVVYRLLEGESANVELEASSLDEFLSMAFANEWIILLNVQKLPPGPIEWCPFLQPRLLQEGEIAKQIRNTKCLNKLIVVRRSDPASKELIPKFVDAETAFVSMLQLLQEEVVSTAKAEAGKQKLRNGMSASMVKMEAAKQKIKNKASATEGSNGDTVEDA